MENYGNTNLKFIIRKYLIVCLVSVAVVVAAVFLYFNGGAKYFLGSLLNGVPINTPSGSNHYAYGENVGWIDFNPSGGNVEVGDNGLAGYAYGENVGWIKLGDGDSSHPPYLNNSSSNWGVNNDGNGNLSGYAYGENVGWISFSGTGYGVVINSTTGVFSGYAYGENVGWISFKGSGYGVVTDWRKQVAVNGACGSASGQSFYTKPSSNLCSAGSATTVSGSGPWTWSCTGSNGGTTDNSCTATLSVDGVCGSAATAYAYSAIAFSGNLCSQGTANPASPTFPSSGNSVTWTCTGLHGGSSLGTCTASVAATPVNGSCGSASGQSSSTAPSTNLCSAGTATAVSGTGPWTWTCSGINGGTDSSACTANLTATTTNPQAPGGGGGGGGGIAYYTISALAGTNGFISPNGSASLSSGSSQTYSIIPAAGYQVEDVLIDGVSKGAITSYTFSNISASHTISATFLSVNATSPATTPTTPSTVAEAASNPAWCYTFTKNLGFADSGTEDVAALHVALQKEGISYSPDADNVYSYATSKAVIQFQTKYGITPLSGYIGPITRAKLNGLYVCKAPAPATPTTPSATMPSATSGQTPTQAQIIDYVGQALQNIKSLIPQALPPVFQPATQPPSNLQPSSPPPSQTPTTGANNQIIIIQIIQKLLKALADLLGLASK
jgi:hypothetical protein